MHLKIGEGVSVISRLAGGGRLKFIAIVAGVVVAIVLGPAIIEGNDYLRANYGSFVSWKGGLFGTETVEPEQEQQIQQEPAAEAADTDTKTPAQEDAPAIIDVHEEQEPAEIPDKTEQVEVVATPSEFTDENFGVLQASPDRFAGYKIAISGQVYDIVDQSTSDWRVLSLRMFVKAQVADESKAVVILQTPKEDISSGIALEDCVTIEGTVRSGIADSDALGRSIKVPLVDSSTVRKIECIDSAMPAYLTQQVEIAQDLNGVRLTVQRVQFTEDHVRIKVAAENVAGGDSVFIREKESFAEQGGKRYDSISQLPIYSPYKLDSKLLPESPSTNYLFFEPADMAGPIVFRIVVEEVKVSETASSVFIFTIK